MTARAFFPDRYTPPAPADAAPAGGGGGGGGLSQLSLQTSKRMMRRYYLVQVAREAAVIGILVGTLSATQRKPMLSALKALCRGAGRKHYVFVMGKLNEAKLANFSEVQIAPASRPDLARISPRSRRRDRPSGRPPRRSSRWGRR